jgi:hypothetical protein
MSSSTASSETGIGCEWLTWHKVARSPEASANGEEKAGILCGHGSTDAHCG